MKKRLLSFAVLFAMTILQVAAQSADDIVKEHIKAMGGSENWAKVNSMKFTGSMEIAPGMKAPFSISMKDKNKMRFEMEIQGMKMIQAIDGDSGWKVIPFTGKTDPERMSPEEIRASKEQADYTGDLYDFKTKGNTVELLGKEDMEGTETYKLKVTKQNGDVKYLYLDAQSYLILKEISKQKFQDKEVESVVLQSNYKNIDGVMIAHTLEMRSEEDASSGQAMTFDKIEVNPEISNSIFVMPPVAAATGSSPLERK